jgi:PhzF family phenazine biosynthesis protein
MELDLYQADAFSAQVFGGNPAAICPLTHWLSDSLMQQIAAENNLSETAFFVPSENGFELRWFTPECEVDLCGHATLATSHIIFKYLGYSASVITFQTRSGELTVRQKNNSLLEMDFPASPGIRKEAPSILCEALQCQPLETLAAADWFVVLGNEQQVRDLKPDMSLLKKLDLRGVCVTAPGSDCDFVSRFFGPKAGINEDPVTGSSHTTLVPYWADRLGKSQLHARQLSKRGGEIFCELQSDRVKLAGYATDYMKAVISI